MSDLDNVLGIVAESIDEETAAQLRKFVEDAAKNAAAEAAQAADWRVTVRSDSMFDKYPRAVNAIRAGIEDDPADEAALAKIEEKMTKLGVADPKAPAPVAAPETPATPAAGWGAPLDAGASPPPSRSEKIHEAMNKGDIGGVIDGIHEHGKVGMGALSDVIAPYQDHHPLPYRRRPA